MLNVLQIAAQAFSEMGLPAPSQVAGGNTSDGPQILALLNREGHELARKPWSELRGEQLIQLIGGPGQTVLSITVAGNVATVQTAAVHNLQATYSISMSGCLPTDYDMTNAPVTIIDPTHFSYVMNTSPAACTQIGTYTYGQQAYAFPSDISWYRPGTSWDRSTHWRTVGPLSDREWQAIRSGIAVAAPFVRWRIFGGQLQIDPVPIVNDTIAFEYISKNWCVGSAPQSAFVLDTDVPLLPDDLFVLGLKWRLLAARGFNYSEEKALYEMAVNERFAAENALDVLDMGRRIPRISNFGFPVIPDGNWPGR